MNTIKVIKIGGNIIDCPDKLSEFLNDFHKIPGRKILIHGGGKIATQMGETMGIKAHMVQGRRVTDAPTLQLVTMIFAGLINKNIVADLQSVGCNALGLTGADGGIITSQKRSDASIDWGYVGDPIPESIHTAHLLMLIQSGFTPVFCAITHDGKGDLLNTNADTMASCIANALASQGQEVELVYCFEKKGVLRDAEDATTLIPRLNLSLYQKLKQEGAVHSGMIPKIDNAFESLQAGVKKVKICMAEDLDDYENAGTTISST